MDHLVEKETNNDTQEQYCLDEGYIEKNLDNVQNENSVPNFQELEENERDLLDDNSKLDKERNELAATENLENSEKVKDSNTGYNEENNDDTASTLEEFAKNDKGFLSSDLNEPEISNSMEESEIIDCSHSAGNLDIKQNESTLENLAEDENNLLRDYSKSEEGKEELKITEKNIDLDKEDCEARTNDEDESQEGETSCKYSNTLEKINTKESIKQNEVIAAHQLRIENEPSETISKDRVVDRNEGNVVGINSIEEFSELHNSSEQNEDESLNKVLKEGNMNIDKDFSDDGAISLKEDGFNEVVQKVGISDMNQESYQSLNEGGLCKETVSENLHEDVLNDILSSSSVTPMDVDLESELSDMAGVAAPMEVE
ncbi:hypothetical protein HHI36_006194 [Cryptolaemus montrouzieri]|uniref:Uncharacterized protein n=1 Tax=Cryptolaemus montrouzieri TaxID=559131 RepID=A0ABD2NWD6_9CUCU